MVLTDLVCKGFEVVGKHVHKQTKFNRNVAVFSLMITVYAMMQHAKIEKLSDEVRELKRAMEE
jgi:hypothetical protein